MNKIFLMGRLTKDAELRYTQSGTAVASFSLAVDRRYKKGEEQQADFINCVAWQKTAEFISQYFRKGSKIVVEGRLQTRSYEVEDGSRRWATEVVVEQCEFADSKAKNENNSATGASGALEAEAYDVAFDDNVLPF